MCEPYNYVFHRWCTGVCCISCLRVLLGAEKSFVYVFSTEGVAPRREVQLAHLTPVNHCDVALSPASHVTSIFVDSHI